MYHIIYDRHPTLFRCVAELLLYAVPHTDVRSTNFFADSQTVPAVLVSRRCSLVVWVKRQSVFYRHN